jgi:hypothetical protein
VPRYFFNIDDGRSDRDGDGTELKDLATAKCEGVKLAGRMICDDADRFWDRREWGLTVTDGAGLILFSLAFLGTEAPATARMLPPQIVRTA